MIDDYLKKLFIDDVKGSLNKNDYNNLKNKPSINDVALQSGMYGEDLDLTSEQIKYGNASSGLSAENVQTAIDLLSASKADIESGICSIILKKISKSTFEDMCNPVTISANFTRIEGLCYLNITQTQVLFFNEDGTVNENAGYLVINGLPFTPKSQFTNIGKLGIDNTVSGKNYLINSLVNNGLFLSGGMLEVTTFYINLSVIYEIA